MNRKPEKRFAAMVVAALDKRVRVEGKLVSRRELILRKLVELAFAKDSQAQKLLLPEMEKEPVENPSELLDLTPASPEARLAFQRAAAGLPPLPRQAWRGNDE